MVFAMVLIRVFLTPYGAEYDPIGPVLFLLIGGVSLISAAGYVINDYYDVKIDAINKPEKVIIGRIVKRRNAILFHLFANAVALWLGYLVHWKVAALFLGVEILLWWYSNQLKRLLFLGNVAISLLTFLLFYLLHVVYKPDHNSILLIATFAFLVTLVREIVKDMEDMEGDLAHRCRTLPIVLGIKRTKIIVAFLIIGIAILTVWASWTFLPYMQRMLYGFAPIFSLLLITLMKADKKKDFNLLSQLLKVLMFMGLIGIIPL